MSRHPSDPQDLLSNILATHEIYAGNNAGTETVTIERLNVHLGRPSGVGLTLSGVHALSTIRRRRPLYLLPPPPPTLIDRATELEALYQTITGFSIADFYGSDGAGKSTLAAALAHSLDQDHFPDGIVYVTGRMQHPDLLQVLFESFYESDHVVKITPRHAPTYLSNLRALVILDDVGLSPKQIDPILDALGNAAVLIASVERIALGRGHAIPLKGLPHPQAVALFEQILGRAPASEEHPIIEQICAVLNNMPLPISCLAALMAQDNGSLLKLYADLQGRKPWAGPGGDLSVGPALEQIILTLDAADRRLLTLLAAYGGPSVSSEMLEALTDLSSADFKRHVKHLQELGLIHTLKPKSRGQPAHLTLPPAYCQALRTWLVDDESRQQIAFYYVTKLNRGERLTGAELPGLLGAIEYCAHDNWLDALKPLVYAADRCLAKLGWWAEWQHVLDLTRRAAQAGGDRILEAWAMHQLGSLLGALGISRGGGDATGERGLHLLQTAFGMRQALGDEAGADLSARNLEVLDYLLPAPVAARTPAPPTSAGDTVPLEQHALLPQPVTEEPASSSPSGAGRARILRIGLTALTVLAVLMAGALVLQLVLNNIGDDSVSGSPGLTVSWEFGDAWNSLDNATWTQQILIEVEGDESDYRFFVDGQPVGEMFEITLPLCEGGRGVIQVESSDGQTAQVEYAFDSPFCR